VRAALSFLTVLPVGGRHAVPGRSALLFFPIVGLGLGGLWAASAYLGTALWTPLVGAALVVAADLAATGALHVDAVADVADGLGSRRPRTEALRIMRAPEVGAVGAAAAAASLLLRFAFVAALAAANLWLLLIAVPALSRAGMVAVLAAGERSSRRSLAGALSADATPGIAAGALALAGAAALLAGVADAGARGAILALAATAAVAAVALLAAGWWRRRFGPLTGDAAGASGMAAELVTLAVLALAASPAYPPASPL
jgi:adenosylcobinamide-GDP ribazoletransferase